MFLSRTAFSGAARYFQQKHIFIIKDFFSLGLVSLKCEATVDDYCDRRNCFFRVRNDDCIRPFSSGFSESRELKRASSDQSELDVDVNAVTGGDPALVKRLKILILEKEVMKQEGYKVPSHIKSADWKELLQLPSRSSRKKFLNYLFGVEMKKENRKRKKEEKRSEREGNKDEEEVDDSDHITYGFRGSTIFVRVYDTTMNTFYNNNAIRAMMFGQKLVFDCSYDPHMTLRESKNCAKQIMISFSENRLHPEPFDLYLTGARPECPTMRYLQKHIPTLYDTTFPINITENSYLDLFSKEKLVYLTPHCREELLEYDHDAVYIVGAMVDKVNNEPLSMAKAKREGLKMAKLPLDRYLYWGSGSGKSLTLNQMLKILLDRKHLADWRKSLVHVPHRKLVREDPPKNQSVKRHLPHDRIDLKDLFS